MSEILSFVDMRKSEIEHDQFHAFLDLEYSVSWFSFSCQDRVASPPSS